MDSWALNQVNTHLWVVRHDGRSRERVRKRGCSGCGSLRWLSRMPVSFTVDRPNMETAHSAHSTAIAHTPTPGATTHTVYYPRTSHLGLQPPSEMSTLVAAAMPHWHKFCTSAVFLQLQV